MTPRTGTDARLLAAVLAAGWMLGTVTGCGDDDPIPDVDSGTRTGIDGGLSPDASDLDATILVDASSPMDATGPDGAVNDAGLPGDATTTDDASAPMCGGLLCDVETGLGCPPGQGCYVLNTVIGGTSEAMCAPAGTRVEGESCSRSLDCISGHFCSLNTSPGPAGRCRKHCCQGTDTCPGESECIGRPTFTEARFCVPPTDCSLVAQTGCEPGLACRLLTTSGATFCGRPGTARLGAECGLDLGITCEQGAVCINFNGASRCQAFCDTGDPMCGTDELCQRLSTVTGNVGICRTVP